MIPWVFVVLLGLSAMVVYKKRFTSEKRTSGMYYVQLYYLVVAVIMSLLFIYIGLNIYMRPEIKNLPVNATFILGLYSISMIVAAMGAAIHSTATSVYQALVKEKQTHLESFRINEIFHLNLSHNFVFIGVILASFFLSVLEINHPSTRDSLFLNAATTITLGVVIGLIEALTILRSAGHTFSSHINYAIIGSAIGSLAIFIFCRPFMTSVDAYPVAFILFSSLVTVCISLLATTIVFATSHSLSEKIVNKTFPSGHPFREVLKLKVFLIKIEREWLE
jgi:hypothetical protein